MTVREALQRARELMDRWIESDAPRNQMGDAPGVGLESSAEEEAAWAEARARSSGHFNSNTNDRNHSSGWDR